MRRLVLGLRGAVRALRIQAAAYCPVGGLLADLDQLAVAADEVAVGGVGGDPVAVAPAVVAAVTPMAAVLEAAEPAVMAALESAALEALRRRRRRGERESSDRRGRGQGEGESRGLDR